MEIFEAAGGCDPGQIDAFEKVLGYRLPRDYRDFLLRTNGGELPPHSISYGSGMDGDTTSIRIFYGLNRGNDWADLLRQREGNIAAGRCPAHMLSIASDDGGYSFEIYLRWWWRRGQIWMRDSEWRTHFVARDFRTFLELIEPDEVEERDPSFKPAPPPITKAEWERRQREKET